MARSLFCCDRLAVNWLQGSSEQSDSCSHWEATPQSQAWLIIPAVQRVGSTSRAQRAKNIPIVARRAICLSLVTHTTGVNIVIGKQMLPLNIRLARLRAISVSREPQTIGSKGDASLKSEARQQGGPAVRCAYYRVNPYRAGFCPEPRALARADLSKARTPPTTNVRVG